MKARVENYLKDFTTKAPMNENSCTENFIDSHV